MKIIRQPIHALASDLTQLRTEVINKADAPYIVEYSNSYLSGGYVLYSDGYCRQWGQRTGTITNLYAGSATEFTFPKAFTLVDRVYASGVGGGWASVGIRAYSTTSVSVHATGGSSGDYVTFIFWLADGWIY